MNERLRALRRELGKSQAEFGKAIGLSQRSISEMEVGTNAITDRKFDAICKTFNVNPEWLRDGVGEMFVEIAPEEEIIQNVVKKFNLTDDDAILIRTYLELTPEQRAGVMAYIKKFAANMAAQMGLPPLEDEKPDYEKTREEIHAQIDAELDARDAARKRGASTSSASIGSSGASKKITTKA